MNSKLIALLLCLIMFSSLYAQSTKLPNVAVSPFAGDKTVSIEQLSFITGKFAAELMATKAFRVLDRGKMDYILKEQGFQQTGACNSSECQVQMGQLLGMDAIISGNMVRFGRKYAFRVDYIDVGSGQVLYSVEQNESGELEDVYEALCRGAARKLAQELQGTATPMQPTAPALVSTPVQIAPVLDTPKPIAQAAHSPLSLKRKIALGLWGSALLGAGSGIYFNSKGLSSQKEYDAARIASLRVDSKSAYEDIQTATTRRNVSYGFSMGTFILGAVLWFWPEGK